MTEKELENEFNEFMAKFAKSGRDFINDFNKLSPTNKQKFQSITNINVPNIILSFQNFLNTKF